MALTEKGRKLRNNLLIALVLVGGFFGLRYAKDTGLGRKYLPSFMVDKVRIADSGPAISLQGSAKEFIALPSDAPANLNVPEIRFTPWAWNSQMGCLYANGGPTTTEGSLMAKQGVKMVISRQDDNNQLMAGLTQLAKEMHGGNPEPTEGTHLIGIMGDGAGAFLRALNDQLIDSFGPDYRAEIIGSCGYSRGEDKLMGPAKWKQNPQTLRGSVIAAVVRDGDWNIVVRYAADNNIPVNADETTYDPKAINFVNTSSYTDAAQKYVSGYCEERRVVVDGKPTSEKKNVCVEGAATWTPGDVTMAKEKGGVVTVISTKEYANQMPNVLIGIRKWNQTHREQVTKMLTAFAQGGDQVLTYPQALDKAAEISAQIYNEADAGYWKKYYLGVREKDAQGVMVDLGGSKANNMADMAVLFGLAPGTSPSNSRFKATYTVFGNLVSKMYPDLVPSVMPVDSVLDLSYLRGAIAAVGTEGGKAETVEYTAGAVTEVVARRGVAIEFASGSAELTAEGKRQITQLADELAINALRVEVHGHTDNTGSIEVNQTLSENRAFAVKTFLESYNSTDFPEGRITVQAHGSSKPVATNSTAVGRKANRRVEIVIGN